MAPRKRPPSPDESAGPAPAKRKSTIKRTASANNQPSAPSTAADDSAPTATGNAAGKAAGGRGRGKQSAAQVPDPASEIVQQAPEGGQVGGSAPASRARPAQQLPPPTRQNQAVPAQSQVAMRPPVPAQQLPRRDAQEEGEGSPATQRFPTPPLPQGPTLPADQYARWANTGTFGSAPADGTLVVDKTQDAQFLKRKATALNEPGSNAQAVLIAKLRAHSAGNASNAGSSSTAGHVLSQEQSFPSPSSWISSALGSFSGQRTVPSRLPSASPLPLVPTSRTPISSTASPLASSNELGLQLISPPAATPSFQSPAATPSFPPLNLLLDPVLAPGYSLATSKLSGYDSDTRTYITTAAAYLQARILIMYGFPQPLQHRQFVHDSWEDARLLTSTWYSLTDAITTYERLCFVLIGSYSYFLQMLQSATTSFRSRRKDAILALVKTAYGLHLLSTADQAARAAQLLNGDVFVYRDWVPKTTLPATGPAQGDQAMPVAADTSAGGARTVPATQKTQAKPYAHALKGKGRVFAHPAILSAVKILAFDKGTRQKTPAVFALLPDEFNDGIPTPLYAFAATTIHHALDTVAASGVAPEFSDANYLGKYKTWYEMARSKFTASSDPRMAELRNCDWADICASYHIVHSRDTSRHDEAIGTDDEE
ncbi:hypothetical protein EXIGLDRAFT_781584 [Exidia glandulosa HHB12029]|uniref:DUF6532 domain-containing protein n=1 Tax=Exidia glandulosa HHB12029 TaxID=1314781 RepID=A0A165Z6Z7_EXIGL|nr:hypothetical protein EXIGLDRAFT_781584 [Exidia glandulosa HHB12029]